MQGLRAQGGCCLAQTLRGPSGPDLEWFVDFLFFFLFFNPQNSLCVASTCMGVEPPTGAWAALQGPRY